MSENTLAQGNADQQRRDWFQGELAEKCGHLQGDAWSQCKKELDEKHFPVKPSGL